MEPERSLPHFQEHFTYPCPKQDQLSPHHPILSLQDPSYYFAPTYLLVFPVVSFVFGFSTNNLSASLFSLHVFMTGVKNVEL
jgi:hypothetical protein